MRRGLTALAALAALVSVLAATSSAAPISGSLTTTLSGTEEVPKGDPNGSGTATIKLDLAKGQVCWTFKLSGIDPAQAAHIHKSPTGKAGPVVVPFGAVFKSAGCTSAKSAVIKDILDNPTRYYVNVHNAAFGPGAVRGQL